MNPAVLQPGGSCDGGRAALSSGYDAAYLTVSPGVSGYVHASQVLLAVSVWMDTVPVSLPNNLK